MKRAEEDFIKLRSGFHGMGKNVLMLDLVSGTLCPGTGYVLIKNGQTRSLEGARMTGGRHNCLLRQDTVSIEYADGTSDRLHYYVPARYGSLWQLLERACLAAENCRKQRVNVTLNNAKL